jgi:hypothetical protein
MRKNAELQRSAQLDLAAVESVDPNYGRDTGKWAGPICSKSGKSPTLRGEIYPVWGGAGRLRM